LVEQRGQESASTDNTRRKSWAQGRRDRRSVPGNGSLRRAGVRAQADRSNGRMQQKIRAAQMDKVPYIVVVGDREVEGGRINLCRRDGSVAGEMSIEALVALVQRWE
jgi:threonyl-tRNA synthetase